MSCADFAKAYPDAPECCGSCHDEWDDGVDSPYDYTADGKTYFLCCAKSNWLHGREQ